MTRLFITAIIGPAARVDSSWIDTLAGLVISGIRNVPPDFCANAGITATIPAISAKANPMRAKQRIAFLPASFIGAIRCFGRPVVMLTKTGRL